MCGLGGLDVVARSITHMCTPTHSVDESEWGIAGRTTRADCPSCIYGGYNIDLSKDTKTGVVDSREIQLKPRVSCNYWLGMDNVFCVHVIQRGPNGREENITFAILVHNTCMMLAVTDADRHFVRTASTWLN